MVRGGSSATTLLRAPIGKPALEATGPDAPTTNREEDLAEESHHEGPAESVRLGRRPVGSGVVALALVAGGFYSLFGSRQIVDNSFLTHLATGREILDGGLPTTNPFLYSSISFPVPSYWWSILVAAVERLGGGLGLRLLTTLLAGALGALIVRLSVRVGMDTDDPAPDAKSPPRTSLLSVVVPTVLTTLCLVSFINPRPHLPGFVLLALAVLVWNERRSPLWLLPLFAAWVNVHGTWLYGLAVLGLFCVVEAIEVRAITRERLAVVGSAIAGVVIGGALYPERFALVLLPTRQFGSAIEREALSNYAEWRAVPLSSPLFWLLLGLGLVALYGCVRTRNYFSIVAVAGLVIMGFSGHRLVPIAAIAMVPLVARGMTQIGTLNLPRGRVAPVIGAFGCALVVVSIANCLSSPAYKFDAYPVELVDSLVDQDLIGGSTRSLSHDYVGNYLEFRLGSSANTFVDDRPGAQTFIDYASLLRLESGWREALATADPDVIIWKNTDKLARELRKSDDWVHAKSVGQYELFCSKPLAERCSRI